MYLLLFFFCLLLSLAKTFVGYFFFWLENGIPIIDSKSYHELVETLMTLVYNLISRITLSLNIPIKGSKKHKSIFARKINFAIYDRWILFTGQCCSLKLSLLLVPAAECGGTTDAGVLTIRFSMSCIIL